jgi:hypothetical protein
MRLYKNHGNPLILKIKVQKPTTHADLSGI